MSLEELEIMTPANAGRRKHLDWDLLDKLCFLQCTGEEISAFMGFHLDHLERLIKAECFCNFAEYYGQKSAGGKISLRRRQFQNATRGSTAMQIWLGKQWLKQTDKQLHSGDESKPFVLKYKSE